MSEILRRSELDDILDRVINSTDDWKDDVDRLLAHDAAIRAEVERLRKAIEIEREGQRSMARAMNEINRLSRLDVAINLSAPAEEEGRDE